MISSSKLSEFYVDCLEHHDKLSKVFLEMNAPFEWIMPITQYHFMVEGFCKQILNVFKDNIVTAIEKDCHRYNKIAFLLYKNRDYNQIYIQDTLDKEWIKDTVIKSDLLTNFFLQQDNFRFLFSLLTPYKYDLQTVDISKHFEVLDFSEHLKNLNGWRNQIVHTYFKDYKIPHVPSGMYDVLKTLKHREEFSENNKNLMRFIYVALKQECDI